MSQERSGSQVVHVRENSDSELEALFKVAMNPGETNKSVPLRMRKLPPSFFTPPEPQNIHHSKDGSSDSTSYNPTSTGGPSIAHIRAHSSPPSLQQTLSAAPPPPQHVRQHSYDLTDDQPLPPGWDMAKTQHGQSHIQGTTTWQDPRKSQSTNNLTSSPPGALSPGGNPGPSTMVNVEKVPLPTGWERAYTPEGEVYFINHVDRTTSWFHPNIPQALQRPGMRLQQLQQQSGLGNQSSSTAGVAGQRQLTHQERQRLQLQKLAMEKERLKKRQDEIARQELMIRALGSNNGGSESDSQVQAVISQASEMTTVADPFLGQTGTELHARQESADSGLGGMGTSYSLPRTPEDFLGNMEEMDTQDGGHKLQGQGDFSMDISTVGSADTGDSQMESEELVPSLQEDISSELENVLNAGKMDNLLTWL